MWTSVRASVRTTRSLMKALAEAHFKADQSFDFHPAGGPKSENIPETGVEGAQRHRPHFKQHPRF